MASRLGQSELKAWVGKELEGYSSGDQVPEYRHLLGEARGKRSDGQWIPIYFPDTRTKKLFTRLPLTNPIPQLEELIKEYEYFYFPYPAEMLLELQKSVRGPDGGPIHPFDARIYFQKSHALSILGSVRNHIVERCIKLDGELNERPPVVEGGITFNVANLLYSGGPIQAPIQQMVGSGSQKLQTEVRDQLVEFADAVWNDVQSSSGEFSTEEMQEIRDCLDQIRTESQHIQPKYSLIKILLRSLRRILESAAGSAIAVHVDKIPALLDLLNRLSV